MGNTVCDNNNQEQINFENRNIINSEISSRFITEDTWTISQNCDNLKNFDVDADEDDNVFYKWKENNHYTESVKEQTTEKREDVGEFIDLDCEYMPESSNITVQKNPADEEKKTFTRWINSFLCEVGMEVDDLFVDLTDGKKLLKLLEIVYDEDLPRPNNGKMLIHKIQNVYQSLKFLQTKVRLESIGPENIVEGSPMHTLGLIWTIIHNKLQTAKIEVDVISKPRNLSENQEENLEEKFEKKSVKDALLLWVQIKTQDYPGIEIVDFSTSWRSGLAFNALIHAHRPDLFDYKSLLNNQSNIDNLNHAFDVAHKELGISRLMDPEDVDVSKPNEKCIITYISPFYDKFARKQEKAGRGIVKV